MINKNIFDVFMDLLYTQVYFTRGSKKTTVLAIKVNQNIPLKGC